MHTQFPKNNNFNVFESKPEKVVSIAIQIIKTVMP